MEGWGGGDSCWSSDILIGCCASQFPLNWLADFFLTRFVIRWKMLLALICPSICTEVEEKEVGRKISDAL